MVPYIEAKGLSKSFGKVIANEDVNLTVNGGEIHALLGENGAGKSTLMNMLSGIYIPDSGSIYIHGKNIKLSSPKDAINAGIGMIHQHFKLVMNFNARDNIALGQKKGIFKSNKDIDKKVEEICSKYDLDLDLNKTVSDMSVSEKQILEIVKVLYRGADILILDEPTTVFTPQETEKLFKIMRKMKENGCAIIFISHKMDEVVEISDRITVLRKGKSISTLEKEKTTPKELTEIMVGHSVDLSIKRVDVKATNSVLKVKDLRVIEKGGNAILKGLSFDVKEGEILGVCGIANSGQKELCEAIVGITHIESGEILFKDENIVDLSTKDIIDKGISMSFVPEDRLGMGLVASMGMIDNFLLKSYHKGGSIFIDKKSVKERAIKAREALKIKTPSLTHPIKDLSGGNIQKILVGRELDSNPKLLIMAYPTRGLDISTCYAIYDLMMEQKKNNVGILYIGEDLDVLLGLCDRILVLSSGEITGIVKAENTTKEELGLMMLGNKVLGEVSHV